MTLAANAGHHKSSVVSRYHREVHLVRRPRAPHPSPLEFSSSPLVHLSCNIGRCFLLPAPMLQSHPAPGLIRTCPLLAFPPQVWTSGTGQTKMQRPSSSASEAWVLMWLSTMTALVRRCKTCLEKVSVGCPCLSYPLGRE